MSLNSAIVTLVDSAAVFVHGQTDSTAAATAAGATGANARTLVNISGTIWATKPITLGEKGAGAFNRGIGIGAERTRGGKRTQLKAARVDNGAGGTYTTMTGSFAVYGVNLPDALSGKPLGNAFATPQTETVKVFRAAADVALSGSATFDASALSTDAINADSKGYNWLVVVNGEIIPWSSAALANILSWSIASGVVTIRTGTAAGLLLAGDDVVVYKLATGDVTQLLAAGIHNVESVPLLAKDVIWTYWTTNQLATTHTVVTVEPIVGA